MEEFNQSRMVSMNNSWDIPLTMEDPINQSNYCHRFSNQIMVPLSSIASPLWSSLLLQSPHQNQALSSAVLLPRYVECAAGASIDQLEEVGFDDDPKEELGPEKEMTYRIAAMQPVIIDPSTMHKPKRRNVWISEEPQSVAARQRRERISEKIRILQRLVPGGMKMDTATMLDEAIHYIKFLKRLVWSLRSSSNHQNNNHPQQIPSIPILFGDQLQIPQADKLIVSSSSSSSMEHFITWSGNSGGDANIHFNHEVTGDQ